MTTIPHPEGAPGFKFSDVTDSDAPNTIIKVDKLDVYLVSYRDGQAKEQVRVCLRIPGSNATFVLQERISGANIATSVHQWFHKALMDKLRTRGLEKEHTGEVVRSA